MLRRIFGDPHRGGLKAVHIDEVIEALCALNGTIRATCRVSCAQARCRWAAQAGGFGTAPRAAASPFVRDSPKVGTRLMDLIPMTDIAQLNQGRFYWVLVRASTKDPEWQPARFTGFASHGAGAAWNFIGFNSDVGYHVIEVVDIGPELTDVRASPALNGSA
jgi:hypothetical protein